MTELLWVDTSVARQAGSLHDLSRQARAAKIRLAIHPQVHLEILRSNRVRHADDYDADRVRSLFQSLDALVPPFDQQAAEDAALRLAVWYPTDAAWQAAKLASIRAALGEGAHLPKRVPMTSDWLIVTAVANPGDRVVVEDKGPEWQAIASQVLTLDEARQWLASRAVGGS